MNFEICCLTHSAVSLGEPYYFRSLLTKKLKPHSLSSSSLNILVSPCCKKFTMEFAPFLTLHIFFGIIYQTLFVLLLHTCP